MHIERVEDLLANDLDKRLPVTEVIAAPSTSELRFE